MTPTGCLIHTDAGRALVTENEEITRWRWARKTLVAPADGAAGPADLWVFVAPYPRATDPLEILLDDQPFARIDPPTGGHERRGAAWRWHRLPIQPGTLAPGAHTFTFRCQTQAMNGWMLGLDASVAQPASAISFDRGRTWRASGMGPHGVLRGDYMVRLRLHEAAAPDMPPITYEDPTHPRVAELRELIPAEVREAGGPWEQTLALRQWICRQWMHGGGGIYAPWDPWTILDWTRHNGGHGQSGRTAFCVHFGAFMTSCAAALGLPARGLVVTAGINTWYGHYMCEVWDPTRGKWVLHDANYDVHYAFDGVPQSGFELADLAHQGVSFADAAVKGDAFPADIDRLIKSFDVWFSSGRSFALTGVWRTNHYVSDPTAAPPNHGAMPYGETDFLWYAPDPAPTADMFPWVTADRSAFDAPPDQAQSLASNLAPAGTTAG